MAKMQVYLLILFLSFFGSTSFSNCSGNGIWAWPQSETISENPVIYIEGYFRDQATVRKIGQDYDLYLTSKSHVARLEVIEILEGQMHLTQVMLKPVKNLLSNVEYELAVLSIPKKSSDLPVKLSLNFPTSKWLVKEKNDKIIPVFTSAPKWISSWFAQMSCGPASGMDIECATSDTDHLLIRTRVINTVNNSENTYYLEVHEGKISIGQNICSGAFRLGVGIKYKIAFCLLDGSWNEGEIHSYEMVYEPKKL